MAPKFLGKKIGMTTLFDASGKVIPCTVISIPRTHVAADITEDKHGYEALQCAAFSLSPAEKKRQNKPQRVFYEKNQLEPKAKLYEFQVSSDEKRALGLEVGSELDLGLASAWKYVDVAGISKGKGFQGSMKRFNMAGGPASHGSSFHRHTGSRGQRSTPGRTFLNQGDPGHMGSERVTIMSSEVVKVDVEKRYILIRGSVPGPNGALVEVRSAVKVA